MAVSSQELNEKVLNEPAVGIQTYEFFEAPTSERAPAKEAFISGTMTAPDIRYPLLSTEPLNKIACTLSYLCQQAAELDKSPERDACLGTLRYRAREARFLITARGLNSAKSNAGFLKYAGKFQRENERLYGLPNQALVDATVADFQAKIAEKDLSGEPKDLADEVHESLDLLKSSNPSDGLPVLEEDAKLFLREQIERYFQIEKQAVKGMRSDMEAEGVNEFGPEQLFKLFKRIIHARGYQNELGVFMKSGTALSWSQKRKGVEIGDKREPVKKDDNAWGLAVHEEGVHGQRFRNGRCSEIAIFGYGLMLESNPDEYADYFGFEEGIANLYQSIASGSPQDWNVANIGYLLNLSRAYQGKSFREIYDENWKLRAILKAKNDTIKEEDLVRVKSLAYDSTLRIFRGTPIGRIATMDCVLLTYNKDLAYQRGRARAIEFWNQHVGDENMFRFLLSGKFDPTNKRHLEIAHAATGGRYESK